MTNPARIPSQAESKLVPVDLLQRPLYISDYGVVSCNNAGCIFTFEHLGHRTNVAELLTEMDRHMRQGCPEKTQYQKDCDKEGLPYVP
jgi:hypothetical protein